MQRGSVTRIEANFSELNGREQTQTTRNVAPSTDSMM